MTSTRFTLLAFAGFLLIFVAIFWAVKGFPALVLRTSSDGTGHINLMVEDGAR